MRVGLDGFPLASPRTGVGHYTFELTRALAEIAPSDQFELISPVPLDSTLLAEFDQSSVTNLQITNPKTTSIRRHWWAVGLPLYLRQTQLDLFHGTNYDVPLWNWDRTVVTIHDLSILLYPQYHEPHLVRRARHRLGLMARSAAMIVTVSESVKREICEHLKVKSDKIAVTREAPRRSFHPLSWEQTAAIRHRLKVEDEFVLFVGTIEPRKNLQTLVRAFEEILRNTSLKPQLVIAGGEGWMMDDLFAWVRSSGLGDRLCFTGYINDEDLRALYSSCRVFVYPSFYEGFGLPPLEAMACGAPVVTSRIPSLVETAGPAACLVSPNDFRELSESIVDLLTNANKRCAFAAAGLERASEFTWERTARETLEVYQEVLKRKKKRYGAKA
jgi:glycosyltransferase involved in cell wall biosynthesis